MLEVDRLCELIGRSFPSATVQPAEALYEGKRRSLLMVRIRTDSTDAVVDLAQRLCLAFQQRFVGVEVRVATFEFIGTTLNRSSQGRIILNHQVPMQIVSEIRTVAEMPFN